MLKFLNKIFGRSSTSYENLMNSKVESNSIDAAMMDNAKELLATLQIPAFYLSYDTSQKSSLPKIPKAWPVNKKGEPLAYHGALCINEMIIEVFMHARSFIKDNLNLQVFYRNSDEYKVASELTINDASLIHNNTLMQKAGESLPIWEELIHREKSMHQQIVHLAPENPWTLYKSAKKELLDNKNNSVIGLLGGYPQWYINDMDYRKIQNANFLLQLSKENEHAYLFLNNDELETYYQRY